MRHEREKEKLPLMIIMFTMCVCGRWPISQKIHSKTIAMRTSSISRTHSRMTLIRLIETPLRWTKFLHHGPLEVESLFFEYYFIRFALFAIILICSLVYSSPRAVSNTFNDINNRSSSAWSSASATPPPLPPVASTENRLKVQRNDLSKNSNVDFANFANVFPSGTADPFLDPNSNSTSAKEDLFAADFNDNFGAAALKKETNKTAFDPFGVSTAMTISSSSSSASKRNGNLFAATFDDDPFGDSLPTADDAVNNNNSHIGRSNGSDTKKKVNNQNRADSKAKYSEDYSKNFDNDLEEVLKRSLFDQ